MSLISPRGHWAIFSPFSPSAPSRIFRESRALNLLPITCPQGPLSQVSWQDRMQNIYARECAYGWGQTSQHLPANRGLGQPEETPCAAAQFSANRSGFSAKQAENVGGQYCPNKTKGSDRIRHKNCACFRFHSHLPETCLTSQGPRFLLTAGEMVAPDR